MAYTLGQAAKAADVSKTTIQRAIKSGRLSALRQEDGSYVIDPAELHRVFPSDGHADSEMASSVTHRGTGELRVEVEMLRERISEKNEVIEDLRRRLDQSEEERRQVQARLTGLLTDQRSAVPPDAHRGWWRRLGGK